MQSWKLDPTTGFLLNKRNGIKNQVARIRSVPKEGKCAAIIRNDGLALGLVNDNTVAGTKVAFQEIDQGATSQIWTRGPADRDGYYFLGNQKSKKFLTSSTDVTIESNPITLHVFLISVASIHFFVSDYLVDSFGGPQMAGGLQVAGCLQQAGPNQAGPQLSGP